MSGQPDEPLEEAAPAESSVSRFLHDNPDFFERHEALLDRLLIPHPTGGAISLIERQVDHLRQRNGQLERQLGEIVQVARQNESLGSHLHRLALELMDISDVDGVLSLTDDLLRNEFPSTEVAIHLLPERGAQPRQPYDMDPEEAQALFGAALGSTQPVFSTLEQAQSRFLFGQVEVHSSVIVPLVDGRPIGLMALGSADSDRFRDGMGTLFLTHLGELVSRALRVQQDRTSGSR